MRVSVISFLAALAVADAASNSGMAAPWGIPRGGAKSSYASKLDAVKEEVLASTLPSIDELRTSIVNEATIVDDFGSKADTIVNKALEEFASSAPEGDDSEV